MLCHITIIKAIATACYSTMTRLLPEDCTGDSTWLTSEGGLDRTLAVVPIVVIESINEIGGCVQVFSIKYDAKIAVFSLNQRNQNVQEFDIRFNL